jgi:hypothetical protein
MCRIAIAILTILIPACALGYLSIYEVHLDGLRQRSWIRVVRVHQWTNDTPMVTSFTVVIDPGDKPSLDEYLRLDLRDENERSLSSALLKGVGIRRAIQPEMAQQIGLESLRQKGNATVYSFTVNSKLLQKSKLSWHFGPMEDENGLPYGGGVIEWCYLSTLAQARQDANTGPANESQPTRSETNRTSPATGSRR